MVHSARKQIEDRLVIENEQINDSIIIYITIKTLSTFSFLVYPNKFMNGIFIYVQAQMRWSGFPDKNSTMFRHRSL